MARQYCARNIYSRLLPPIQNSTEWVQLKTIESSKQGKSHKVFWLLGPQTVKFQTY